MIMVVENQDTLAVQEDKELPYARQNSQASKQSFNFPPQADRISETLGGMTFTAKSLNF